MVFRNFDSHHSGAMPASQNYSNCPLNTGFSVPRYEKRCKIQILNLSKQNNRYNGIGETVANWDDIVDKWDTSRDTGHVESDKRMEKRGQPVDMKIDGVKGLDPVLEEALRREI